MDGDLMRALLRGIDDAERAQLVGRVNREIAMQLSQFSAGHSARSVREVPREKKPRRPRPGDSRAGQG